MKKKEDDIDKYIDEIIDYIEQLDEHHQLIFISNVVSRACIAGKLSHIERLGVLDCARVDVTFNVIIPDVNDQIGNVSNN